VKIAILGIKTLPAFAGADRVVERLLEHFPDGNEYYIYLLKSGKPELKCTDKCHYIYLPALRGKHLKPFSFFTFCTLHFLLKGKYDIAHVHNEDFGFFVPLLKLKRHVKVIGTLHGSAFLHLRKKWGPIAIWYLQNSEKVFVRECDYLTTVAKSVLQIIPESKIHKTEYIPNGIEINIGTSDKEVFEYEKFNLEKNGYVLFACGRLDSTKGLHHLIKAFNKNNYGIKLFAIGGTNHDRSYEKYIQSISETNPHIILHRGLFPKEQLYEVIRNCRVFVFPSEYEAMSMMLLEVISCRKLVVCSSIAENVEVTGADYPYLFSLDNDNDLSLKLERALNEKNTEKFTRSLYESCIKRFSWETIAQQYFDLYNRALSGT